MSHNSSPSPARHRSAASILAARRRNAEQGPRLPESCRPLDVDSALAIQSSVTGQLGVPVRAWKCATPAEDRIVMAPIYAVPVQEATIRYGDLGDLTVRFSQR